MKDLLRLAALLVLLVPSAALADASSEQYRGCDGYGAASDDGDGMTRWASVLLIFNPPGYGNTERHASTAGDQGIADCNAALADLPAKHWMRKVSLLRARALHRLDDDDTANALADLDAADAVAKEHDDPFFTRSLGVGLDITRAYITRRAGNQAAAETMALDAIAERPFSRQVVASALIAMGPKTSEANLTQGIEDIARIVPTTVDELFLRAFDEEHFDQAIALYPGLVAPREIGDLNISADDLTERQWRDFRTKELFATSRAGAYAYALAATGKAGQARAALADARAMLAADCADPPPLSDKDAKDSDKVAVYQGTLDIHKRMSGEGGKVLDHWNTLVEARLSLADGKAMEVLKAIPGYGLAADGAGADLIDAVFAALPKKARPKTSPADTIRAKIAAALSQGREPGSDVLVRTLPDAETADRVPDYSQASKPLFASRQSAADLTMDGYTSDPPDADGAVAVGFRAEASTQAMVEECALLRAAELARAAGKKGMIVTGRFDTKFETTTTYYGTPLRSDPNGYRTMIEVVFVDPAALPEKFQGAPWRVLDADAVYAALAPVYIKAKPAK